MDLNILQDIREIIHGLGEKRPRIDAVKTLQSVLVKQMALLIYQTQLAAYKNNSKIHIKHIIYVLKDYKYTIIRLLSYYLIKENMNQYTTASYTQDLNQECCKGNKNEKLKLINKDFVDTMLNFEESNGILHFDPVEILTTIDFKSNIVQNGSRNKNGIFNQIVSALKEFESDIKITKEDIINSKKDRTIRVNELSLVLSANRYEEFGYCRTKNFLNKKGDLLLNEAHKALPLGIIYNKDIKSIFLFLAKETLACLFDRLCKNRIFVDVKPEFNFDLEEEDARYKVSKHDSILVPEITLVVNSIWKQSLGDICIPYQEDNTTFFNNKFIFD